MRTIEKDWHSYRDEVLPQDAPISMLVETRRAFYAGARCAITVTHDAAMLIDTEMEFSLFMDEIERELADFVAAVTAGKA